MSSPLADEPVEPADEGAEPLTDDEYAEYLAELGPVWEVVDDHHLEATYEFDDFADALAFTNEIGELAEAEGITPISTSRGARSASRCGATTSAGSTIRFRDGRADGSYLRWGRRRLSRDRSGYGRRVVAE